VHYEETGGEKLAKTLEEWVEEDVEPLRGKTVRWLSEAHFFRDPLRAVHSDPSCFFAPADGIILYQEVVKPDERLVAIKGRDFTLREAMRDPSYEHESVVVGIFMTFYDVHINRMPYSGRLSYRELEPIDTYNYPMLPVEKAILDDLEIDLGQADYLRNNQRMLNRVHASSLGLTYHMLQIADFDVDSVTPFELRQNQPCGQNERFSQIRYGSQVDLIVPLSSRYAFEFTQQPGLHVEAGVDTLLRINER
jgi:phosphatidylserine decarboxylase